MKQLTITIIATLLLLACQKIEDTPEALEGVWTAIGLTDRTETIRFRGDRMIIDIVYNDGSNTSHTEQEYSYNERKLFYLDTDIMRYGVSNIPKWHNVTWINGNKIQIDTITYVR